MSTVHTTALAVLLLSAGTGVIAQDPALLPPPQTAPVFGQISALVPGRETPSVWLTRHRPLRTWRREHHDDAETW